MKRFRTHTEQGAPLCGFVSYIHPTEPKLLCRMGWEVSNDIHDAFSDMVSEDNGQTWSEPRQSLSHIDEDGGHIVFIENTIHYCADRNILVHLVDQLLQPSMDGGQDSNHSAQIRITVAAPEAFLDGSAEPSLISDFGLKQGLVVSFCNPFRDAAGRLLVPVQWQAEDKNQSISSQGFATREDMPDVLADVWECALLIGTWNAAGGLDWTLGQPVPYDFAISSRGLYEGTVTELAGGRLAMLCRGSNAAWPEKPGYKWLTFSEDDGLTWSQVQPLACDDGTLLQSSSTGSALFRSSTDGELYWIGNLCIDGGSARGNDPRSPLVVAQVQEEPFALKRETIQVIASRQEGEDETVQLSNFRYYQDRVTGELVFYLTRYGERGSADGRWLLADCYEYRVALDTAGVA